MDGELFPSYAKIFRMFRARTASCNNRPHFDGAWNPLRRYTMARISSSTSIIQPHYEIVVVGSGYGGGIAASRLSRAHRQVCVLERGKEIRPGEYPANDISAAEQLQVDLPD